MWERDALLSDDGCHEVTGQDQRYIEEIVEDLQLAFASSRDGFHYADGGEEDDGYGGGEPGNEEDEGLGVIPVKGVVELREDGAAEANEALEQPQYDPPALREVLHAGDKGAGVGEGLGVRPDADVEAHLPEAGLCGPAGDCQVDHQIAEEVHSSAHGEDEPRRRDLGDEAGDDADVCAEVLEEPEGVQGLLIVTERRFDVLGVDAEDVGSAGGGHDQHGRKHHEPSSTDDVGGEPQSIRHP